MDLLSIVAAAVGLVGAGISSLKLAGGVRRAIPSMPRARAAARLSSTHIVWIVFAGAVLVLGAVSLIRYWPGISRNGDLVIFALWLFLCMVFGMFVQVVSSNHRAGRKLFAVSAGQMILPVLFSPIVFYLVWATAGSTPTTGLFPYYSAFMSGYFWETVVSKADLGHPPSPAASAQG